MNAALEVRLGNTHNDDLVRPGMTSDEAVSALTELNPAGDPEGNHTAAEAIILSLVSDEVRTAYLALSERFWYA